MEDVFGKALYSCWKGDHRTPCVIKLEDGYSDSTEENPLCP